jgi:hypothetical protein
MKATESEANQEKTGAGVERYDLAPRVRDMHLLTTPQGWASDVLHGDPREVTYEETIRATEDWIGDQHLAVEYRNQLKTWTQDDGESP